jgi:ribosome-binding protein aMBF1 (putative translation factor)
MHMYSAAIESLPDPGDHEFTGHAAVILVGLRKFESALSEAARRSRTTPAVIVSLSSVRSRYDDLMATAANGPGATLGQRLYVARERAKLSTQEAGNGIGLRADLIEAIEREEIPTEDEAARIKELIAALGG